MIAVSHLYVYPIKACQGVELESAKALSSGLEYDRSFCVVDLNGTRYSARQSLSQRQLPKLASIGVAFVSEKKVK